MTSRLFSVGVSCFIDILASVLGIRSWNATLPCWSCFSCFNMFCCFISYPSILLLCWYNKISFINCKHVYYLLFLFVFNCLKILYFVIEVVYHTEMKLNIYMYVYTITTTSYVLTLDKRIYICLYAIV
jgi:hypothetical protein